MARAVSDEDLLRIFKGLDKDGSGSISITELKEAFKKKGLDEKETKRMFVALDSNKDGKVTKAEFMKNANHIGNKARVIFSWYMAFDQFDQNGTGFLSRCELAQMLRENGVALSPDQLNTMFAKLDANHDDKIDFKEFVCWIAPKDFNE